MPKVAPKPRLKVPAIPLVLLVGLLFGSPGHAGLLLNEGFETPAISAASFMTIVDGDANDASADFVWDVTAGSIDIVTQGGGVTFDAPFEGLQFIDLVGTGSGSTGAIAQNFATEVGVTYLLGFAYSSNPVVTSNGSTADVTVDDGSSIIFSDDIAHNTSSSSDFDWQIYLGEFTASSSLSTLTFTDTGGSINGGIFLDGVIVQAADVPAPASVVLILGIAGLCALRKSQLG